MQKHTIPILALVLIASRVRLKFLCLHVACRIVLALSVLITVCPVAFAATAHSIFADSTVTDSGVAGSKSKQVTTRMPGDDAFLWGLTFDETGDKPCFIDAHWWRFTSKAREDFTTRFDICNNKADGDRSIVFHSNDVKLPAVDSVKVCQSSDNNPRLKGATLTAAAIDRNYLARIEPALLTRTFKRTNCSSWSKVEACPSGQTAVGLNIYHDDKEITGLSLKCVKPIIGSPTPIVPSLSDDERYRNFENDILVQVDENGRVQALSINQAIARHEVNAVSVVMIRGGKIDRVRHYGVKSRKTEKAVDDNTLYQAASMSKLPAAIAMLTAARATHGPRLERTVRNSSIEFPNSVLGQWVDKQFKGEIESGFPDDITVDRLISHSAGLDTHAIGTAHDDGPTQLDTILLGKIGNPGVKAQAAPGTEWDYSGGGVTAAEALLEAHTGLKAREFLSSNILHKFGMSKSTYDDANDSMTNLARGCSRGLCSDNPEHTEAKFAGGLLAVPKEYARLVQILYLDGRDPDNPSSQLIPVEDIQRLLTPASHRDSSRKACSVHTDCRSAERCYNNKCLQPLDAWGDWYGYGMFLTPDSDDKDYPRFIEHGGAQTNAHSQFKLDRQTGNGIVVFVAGDSSWTKDKVTYGAKALLSDILSSYSRNY
jgi:CubicO group peptidase (beta-lactamase class C family)